MRRRSHHPILSEGRLRRRLRPSNLGKGGACSRTFRSREDKKRGDSLREISPIFRGQNYFAASTVSAAASVAVESACSQAAVESHFSVQASQAEVSVAAASVAAASAAAFLLAFPQQPTMATAARTMTKEKIFFMASNVLIINKSYKHRKDRHSKKESKENLKNFQKRAEISSEGRQQRLPRS